MLAGAVLLTAALMLSLFAAPASARTFTLESRGPAPEQASGSVRFTWLNNPADGIHRVKASFKAENLPARSGRVYVLWLMDKESGQLYELGVFNTDESGNAKTSETLQISTLDFYEEFKVTSEPLNDPRPGADGPVVLEGTGGVRGRHNN